MLRKIIPSRGSIPLVSVVRHGGGEPPATYKTELLEREYKFKKIREYQMKLQAEREHVASLPGVSSDEYKPSLEPGSINLRSMHPPYYSPQLRSQTRATTEAALQTIAQYNKRIHSASQEEKFSIVEDVIKNFKFVLISDGDPLTESKWVGCDNVSGMLRIHGIVRGVEGFMFLNLEGDEQLAEICVELSGNTWIPQAWAGGHFVGCWRTVMDHHNSGSLVQILEDVGLSSKLKGCYYVNEHPGMVKH